MNIMDDPIPPDYLTPEQVEVLKESAKRVAEVMANKIFPYVSGVVETPEGYDLEYEIFKCVEAEMLNLSKEDVAMLAASIMAGTIAKKLITFLKAYIQGKE